MARAARTASVIAVLLGALALAPSMAHAAVVAQTEPVFPAEVTVGQTGVAASLALTNANDGTELFAANKVCNVSSPSPCSGTEGITLVPSCFFEGEGGCGDADPGVFDISSTAVGAEGSSCAETIFDVTDLPGPLGAVLFTPTMPPGELTLPGEGAVGCTIDFTFDVLRMPAGTPAAALSAVVQPFGEASQYSAMAIDFDRGISSVTVKKATPAIATSASASVAVGAGVISDSATVSGRVSPTAGATVTFKLFGPGDTTCAAPISTSAAVSLGAGSTVTSPAFTPTQPGTYRWIATYSGDENNAPVSGACNDPGESVTVAPAAVTPPPPRATPTIAILASPDVRIGGSVSAVAALAGRANPVPGATVLFRLFGPDDPGCGATPLFGAAVPVDAAGIATSPLFAPPLQSGVYRWTASYSGDPNNAPIATACNAPSSTVTVTSLPPDVLSAGFASPPRVGRQSLLDVAAFDPLRPIAGLQVRFGEPRGLAGVSACKLSGFGVSPSPIRLRLPYIFRVPGRHKITIVVLSGGCGGELTRTVTTLVVDVAASQSTRAAFAAGAREPIAGAAQSSCKNTFLRPTGALSRARVATAILCLVNVERRKQRLKALKPSKVLARAAGGHSTDMLKRRFFEHAGPGGPSFKTRMTRVRYRGSSAAENIGYGSRLNAKLMVQAWMNSPPHKANILALQSKFAGVGIAVGIPVTPGRPGSTYTMNFGASLK